VDAPPKAAALPNAKDDPPRQRNNKGSDDCALADGSALYPNHSLGDPGES